MIESASAFDELSARMFAHSQRVEAARAIGRFSFVLRESLQGPIRWSVSFDNVVCTQGKNIAMDAYLGPSPVPIVGPYLGLISSTGFVATNTNDTMLSHPGWNEAGAATGPNYTGPRPLAVFTPAVNNIKMFGPPATFTFTSNGTITGAFLTLGPGASNTPGTATGALYSAGSFAAAQPVISGNVLDVTYAASL